MAKLTKNTKTTTTLTEKGMLNEVGEIVTDVEKSDLLTLLNMFNSNEIDFTIKSQSVSMKIKGIYDGGNIVTEEAVYDLLEVIKPLTYSEVKISAKLVEEDDCTEE